MTSSIRHVVLFSFRPDLSAVQIDEAVRRFGELVREIDTVRGFEWGGNVSPEGLDHDYTHCFLLHFDDLAGRDGYLAHPAHLAFVSFIQPLLTQALVVDFQPQTVL